MTPWQGSGAGQAIEDAMVLEAVLGAIEKPSQLGAAFEAYDEIRRPRAQRIVESSRAVGWILCGKGADIGLDVDKMRGALGEKWMYIHGMNQKDQKAKCLEALRQRLSSAE
jgi:salicylate hydroxylase